MPKRPRKIGSPRASRVRILAAGFFASAAMFVLMLSVQRPESFNALRAQVGSTIQGVGQVYSWVDSRAWSPSGWACYTNPTSSSKITVQVYKTVRGSTVRTLIGSMVANLNTFPRGAPNPTPSTICGGTDFAFFFPDLAAVAEPVYEIDIVAGSVSLGKHCIYSTQFPYAASPLLPRADPGACPAASGGGGGGTLSNGLMHHWKFDEASGLAIDSIRATNGTLINMEPDDRITTGLPFTTGNIRALNFSDASEYVDVPGFAWPAGGDVLSMAYWTKLPSQTWQHTVLVTNGMNGTGPFPTNGGWATMYQNGVVVSGVVPRAPTIALNGLRLSTAGTGQMDDVRIYNRALTVTEAQQLAAGQGGTPPPPPPPPPANRNPIGIIDAADCTSIRGWMCDQDSPTTSIPVHFYRNASAYAGGAPISSVTANIPSEAAVNSQCGGGTAHRFSFPIPDSLKTGSPIQVFTHPINTPTGNNPPLPAVTIQCTVTPPPPPPPPAGSTEPVAHWKFDEATGTQILDSSPNGKHGTMTNMEPTDRVPGVLGNALVFDGGEYVDIPGFTWPSGSNPVTVSFWNKVTAAEVTGAGTFGNSNSNDRFSAHAPWSDNQLYWDYGGSGGPGRLTANYGSHLNKWTLVTLVSAGNGGSFKAVYLDGQPVASANTASDGPDAAINGFRIGQSFGTYFHKGILDDVRIYNRVLSAAEIQQLYASAGSNPGQNANRVPIGSLDGANCTSINGWTCDQDAPTTPLAVHIYRDGQAGAAGASLVMSGTADLPRPDVQTLCGGGTAHGFSIPVPAALKDGQHHAYYIHPINIPTGNNPPLSTTFGMSCGGTSSVSSARSSSAGPTTTADLAMTKSVQLPGLPGEPMIYTINYQNKGPNAATNAVLTVGLDPRFASLTSPQSECKRLNTSTFIYTCPIGRIEANATGTVALTARGVNNSTPCGVLETSFDLRSDATDPVFGDNRLEDRSVISCAAVSQCRVFIPNGQFQASGGTWVTASGLFGEPAEMTLQGCIAAMSRPMTSASNYIPLAQPGAMAFFRGQLLCQRNGYEVCASTENLTVDGITATAGKIFSGNYGELWPEDANFGCAEWRENLPGPPVCVRYYNFWKSYQAGYRGSEWAFIVPPGDERLIKPQVTRWRFNGITKGRYEIWVTWANLLGLNGNDVRGRSDGMNLIIPEFRMSAGGSQPELVRGIGLTAQDAAIFDGRPWVRISPPVELVPGSYIEAGPRLLDAVRIIPEGAVEPVRTPYQCPIINDPRCIPFDLWSVPITQNYQEVLLHLAPEATRVAPGASVKFTITVFNRGASISGQGLTVNTTSPAGTFTTPNDLYRSKVVQHTYIVNAPSACGATMTETATLGSISSAATVTVDCDFKPPVLMRSASATVRQGEPARFTYTIRNTRTTQPLPVMLLRWTPPAGATLGALPSGCTNVSGTVNCTVPSIPANSNQALAIHTIEFSATLPATAACGSTVSDSAVLDWPSQSVIGKPSIPAGSATAQGTATVDCSAASHDLAVTVTANLAQTLPNGSLLYTIIATNKGNTSETSVGINTVLTNATPGATLPAGCTSQNNNTQVYCTIDLLLAGQSRTFVIPATTSPTCTTGYNHASLSAHITQRADDANTADNSAGSSVPCGPVAASSQSQSSANSSQSRAPVSCSTSAALTCGNCVLDPGEQCDDGNTSLFDGCNQHCYTEYYYACTGEPSICVSDAVCGNSIPETLKGEVCDDGNTTSGDGCSSTCKIESGFQCMNGWRNPTLRSSNYQDYSRHWCTRYPGTCGNGIPEVYESCDDGNTRAGDGCSQYCFPEYGYRCNYSSPSQCALHCGNGIIERSDLTYPDYWLSIPGGVYEKCDDGNRISGDGCDGNCWVEDTFACTSQPSSCTRNGTPMCGNKNIEAGEECDDGNRSNGDLCTSECKSWGSAKQCGDGLFNTPLCGQPGIQMTCSNPPASNPAGEQCDVGGRCANNPTKSCYTSTALWDCGPNIECRADLQSYWGCRSCQSVAVCGDGTVQAQSTAIDGASISEQCDNGGVCAGLPGQGYYGGQPCVVNKPNFGNVVGHPNEPSCTCLPVGKNGCTKDCQPFSSQPRADLSVTIAATTAVAMPGQPYAYTVGYQNAGPHAATNTTIRITFPTGYVATAFPATCSRANNVVTCYIGGSLNSNGQGTIAISGTLPQSVTCTESYATSVTITSNAQDAQTANNTATHQANSACLPDLSLTGGPVAILAGGRVEYTYMLISKPTNPPTTVHDVLVTFTSPPNFTFDLGTFTRNDGGLGSCTSSQGAIRCDIGTIDNNAVGAQKVIKIAGNLSNISSLACGATVPMGATASMIETDARPSDNTSQSVASYTCVNTDMSATLTGSAPDLRLGQTFTYTAAFRNNGPQTATNVYAHLDVPEGLTIDNYRGDDAGSYTACSLTGRRITCRFEEFTVNRTLNIVANVTVPSSIQCASNLSAVATIPDSQNNANNTATLARTVNCSQANVAITKGVDRSSAHRTEKVLYTISYGNLGPEPATNVVIRDLIGGGMSFGTVSDSRCVVNGATLTCTIGTLLPGSNSTLTVEGYMHPSTVCDATNVNAATIESAQNDPVPANNAASIGVRTDCAALADMTVYETGGVQEILAGQTVQYSINARPIPPNPATNVVVTGTLPSQVATVAAPAGPCVVQGNTFTCTFANVAANSYQQFSVAATLRSDVTCGTPFSFPVSATAAEYDPNTANNSATITTNVKCPKIADLAVRMQASGTPPRPGGDISFSLLYVNNGPDWRDMDVIIRMPFPSNITYVGDGAPNCNIEGSEFVCRYDTTTRRLGTLEEGVNIFGRLSTEGACRNVPVTATIETNGAQDPNLTNNTVQFAIPVDCPPAPSANVKVTIAEVANTTREATIPYQITVHNIGTGPVGGITLQNILPAFFTTAGTLDSRCNESAGQGFIACTLAGLTTGQSTTISVPVTVSASAPCNRSLANAAQVMISETDTDLNDNAAQIFTRVNCQ